MTRLVALLPAVSVGGVVFVAWVVAVVQRWLHSVGCDVCCGRRSSRRIVSKPLRLSSTVVERLGAPDTTAQECRGAQKLNAIDAAPLGTALDEHAACLAPFSCAIQVIAGLRTQGHSAM